MEEKILPKLLVRREEAREKLEVRIDKGQQLCNRQIASEADLSTSRDKFSIWSCYNTTLLHKLFSDTSVGDEFRRLISYSPYASSHNHFQNQSDRFKRKIDKSIIHLKGICQQLELYEECSYIHPPENEEKETVATLTGTFANEVFIVHGRDDEAKVKVARFVERLGIEATILHEKPSSSLTIIEKIEKYSDRVGFAIVLLTPDDIGALKHNVDDKSNPRARQNVVFELGYFMGKLGRERVCPLFKGEIEKPSDIDGIVYVPMDDANGWQLKLAQEMKQAGLLVDMNKLV